jgi:hypothetical protein
LGVTPRSPQASVAWGLSSCARALAGIISRAGAKGRAWRCLRSGAQGSGKPPSPRRRLQLSQAWLDLFARGCARACPLDIAPEPLGDPEGVGRGGSSLFGNQWTQGLTYLYGRISSMVIPLGGLLMIFRRQLACQVGVCVLIPWRTRWNFFINNMCGNST